MSESGKKPFFTIIIPSYNEKDDVRISIDSAIGQTYPLKEIVVVDDSNDGGASQAIIGEYANQGVKLVNGPRKGCCEARNLGIKDAQGDVILILHADVAIPNDFLERVAKHYEAGADWVQVRSQVFNTDELFARFVELQYLAFSFPRDNVWGTEGMSFRRDAALKVGGYTGEFSVKFCRDWTLGKKLTEAGYKKVLDRSIVVTHKAPGELKEYWQVRKTRGRFAALLQYYMWKRSIFYLGFKFLAKDVIFFLNFLTFFNPARWSWQLSRLSDKPHDFWPMFYAYFLQEAAIRIGEWEGMRVVFKTRKRFAGERVREDLHHLRR